MKAVFDLRELVRRCPRELQLELGRIFCRSNSWANLSKLDTVGADADRVLRNWRLDYRARARLGGGRPPNSLESLVGRAGGCLR